MAGVIVVSSFRRITAGALLTAAVGVLLLSTLALPPALSAENAPHAWWEAETAMEEGGLLRLDDKSWWPRARKLKVGEHFLLKSGLPGGKQMLVRREKLSFRGKQFEAIVWVIDDDGDFKPDDRDGDEDSDCYVADYHGNGKVDQMVDYLDNDDDGKPDEMDIRYFDNGRLRRSWFAVDLDGDGHMWDLAAYQYPFNFFLCDPYGDNMIYFNGYDAERNQWFPASECPFSFHDTDADGQSEAVVRVSAVPLCFDPARHPDLANDVNVSSAPRTDQTRKIGALNIRYGIDLDGLSSTKRPLHYDLGFNMIGRVPYQFDGMRHTNPLRRAPKTTICIPHRSARRMAETYPADLTGFSWHEFSDDTRKLGWGEHAEEDRRWEGVFWTWNRRVMHNTGGPTQTWNMRREFRPTPSIKRELYYCRTDRRIHLKGATEGWIRVGHVGNRKPLGEIRFFDTNDNGYFDRWEVYCEEGPLPVRVSTVLDPDIRELPADWGELQALYTGELLPEALRANEKIMAAMRAVDTDYHVLDDLANALKAAPSDSERRYIQDIIRERQYQALREKLARRSTELLAKGKAPSVSGWDLARSLSELDVAYGAGRYDDAIEILETLAKCEGAALREAPGRAVTSRQAGK